MTRSKYFFYPKNDEKDLPDRPREGARILPSEHGEEIAPPSFAFRAGSTTLCHPLTKSAERMGTEILADLSSMQNRMDSKKLAVPFSSILALLSDFCRDFPHVTTAVLKNHELCVATCTHNLLFVIGMVIHHATANAVPLTVSSAEDHQGALIRLQAEQASLTPEEAAEHFGISPYRMAVMTQIAAASDFTIEAIPADRSELCFRLPIYTPDSYRVFALDDPTLYQAFMQPLFYFIF